MGTSDLTLLETLLLDWRELLSLWAANGTLARAAQNALQLEGVPEKLRELVGEWSQGDFRNLPPVVLLPASAMPGAVGAYAISTGTIYLNQDWLALANKERVIGVLTEELGHHLDGLLNVNDTPGDEGELFSTLVLGENLQAENLALLGEENDNSTISLNQDKVLVELSSSFTHPAPGSNRTWSIDGAPGGYEGHTGQDFAYTSASRPQIPWILASKSGKVIKLVSSINYNIPFVSGQKPPQNGYGNHIVIDHGDGYTTLYAHLNSVSVTNGQSVAQGQIIGVMGNTGWSSKEHLHFEIRRVDADGKLIFENPWPLINGSPPLPPIAPPPPTADSRLSLPIFDPAYYLATYADVRNAYGATNHDGAKSHWLEFGIKEGRRGSLVFDPKDYLQRYQDVANAYGATNYAGAISHWLEWGLKYGRRGSQEFDPIYYMAAHPDVEAAYGVMNFSGAISHYYQWGKPGGWSGSEWITDQNAFQLGYYLNNNADVKAVTANANQEVEATRHWYFIGIYEGRRGSAELDSKFYLANNPDVRAAYGDGNYRGAIDHYLLFGKPTGRAGANDTPRTLSISDASISEGNNGARELSFVVSLNIVSGETVAVNFNTSNGTAASGSDYSATSGSLSFSPGETSKTVVVQIIGDSTHEGNEAFYVNLSGASNAAITRSQGAGTILNDDPANNAPTALGVSVNSFNENIAAGSTVATLATTDPDPGNTFSYSLVSGSGDTDNNAFSIAGNQLSIKASPDFEAKDSYSIRVRSTDQGGLSFERSATFNVIDVSEPVISLSVSPTSVTEDGTSNINYTFTRIGATTSALTVNYSVGGTATHGTDYSGIAVTPATKTVSFAANSATAIVTVDPTADAAIEPDETIALTLAAGTGYSIGTTAAVVGTILNDDTVIENQGNTKLLKRGDGKAFVEVGGTRQEITSPWGSPAGDNTSEWQMIAADTISGNNQILWRNNTSSFLHLWSLDANWNWQSSSGADAFNSPRASELETSFQIDATRDGVIGSPFTTIEAQGNTKLLKRGDGKAFVEVGGARQEITSPWGGTAGDNTSEWQMIAADTISGNNQILWRNNTSSFLHLWSLDANWNWQSSSGADAFNSPTASELETSFQIDATGDGIIGIPFTTIESQGNTKLLKRGDGKAFVEVGGARQEITSPWGGTAGNDSSEWQMIAADIISGNNQILWRNNISSFLHLWSLDANWNWQSSSGADGFNTPRAWELETSFRVDATRDGIIGAPFTAI